MRRVATTYTCDRCGDTREFDGSRDHLPSHWTILRVTDGGDFRYLTALICLTCRHKLEAFMAPERVGVPS